MHISNAFSLTNQTNTSRKSLVRPVDSVTVSKTEREQSLNKQANQSIVIDEQAIALFEQNQFAANATESNMRSSTFSSTDQDQPSLKNETAVASYQAIGNLAQRESVQQLFGVDIFA